MFTDGKSKPRLVANLSGFFAFLGVDEKGNPAAIFPDLFARRYRFFNLDKCVG